MTKPLVMEKNGITNEEVIREMTDEEYESHLNRISKYEALKLAEEEKKQKKQLAIEKLAIIGITEEEAKLLLS
jgi:hypothetical protein